MGKKNDIEQLKEQTTNLCNQIKIKDEYITQLETIPLIAKYNAYLYDREKLQEEYENKLKEFNSKKERQLSLLQEKCSHPLWYYMGMDLLCKENKISITSNFRMKCLKCGKEHVFSHKDMMWERLILSLIDGSMNGKMLYKVFEKSILYPITTSYETIKQEFQELEKNGIVEKEITQRLFNKYTIGEFSEEVFRTLHHDIDKPFQFDDIVQTYPLCDLLSEEYQKLYYKLRNKGHYELYATTFLKDYLEYYKIEDYKRKKKI